MIHTLDRLDMEKVLPVLVRPFSWTGGSCGFSLSELRWCLLAGAGPDLLIFHWRSKQPQPQCNPGHLAEILCYQGRFVVEKSW